MFKNTILLFTLLSITALSQSPAASRYELRWALFHPVAAIKVKKITKKCFVLYNQKSIPSVLDTISNGGKLDAFRHVLFMSAYSQKIKSKKIRKLGIAHEKANYRQFLNAENEFGERPDSLSSEMDLRNNELGILLGKQNKNATLEELSDIVKQNIHEGHAFIIKRSQTGHFLTCDGKVIDMTNYVKKWSVPKCLVSSNK